MPKTIAEAIREFPDFFLKNNIDLLDFSSIPEEKIYEVYSCGIAGGLLRKQWNLWKECPLREYFWKELDVGSADDISFILFVLFHRFIHEDSMEFLETKSIEGMFEKEIQGILEKYETERGM